MGQVTVVMKFGGSSLASAERMREVADIVCSFPEQYPCIVLSAMGKVGLPNCPQNCSPLPLIYLQPHELLGPCLPLKAPPHVDWPTAAYRSGNHYGGRTYIAY